jgi:LacI family transcriptional regulator
VNTGGVAQDPSEIGHLAATMLFARIDGDPAPARTVVVPTRLTVRGSGELPPT